MENGKNYACTGLWHPIHCKMIFFQPSWSKTVGQDKISCSQSVIFHEKGKTHQNTTILTMCKIYNVNNYKTADIGCIYYYIGEII